jgi:methylated-DNA-[protein]-cysteine S-methyltransferase
LITIPYGRTISYEALAIRIGNIKSIRAVGLANGQNQIAIIIPCHRVIGKSGELVGYGGGLETKEWLLYHEGALLRQLTLFNNHP